MKRFTITFILLLSYITLIAQVPAAFSYQAVVRNTSGEVIADKSVSLKISILRDSDTGTPVYVERHNTSTNEFGLVNLAIGKGTVISGIFDPGGWGLNKHFMKVELDPAGGSTFVHLGTTQLLSVPYAFHAKTVEDADDADADPANEIQTLSISGTDLTLSKGGGTVPLPSSGGGDNWGSQTVVSDATLDGNGTTATPLKVAQQGATNGQVLKWNGTSWAPGADMSGSSLWSQNGANIFYNTGKVGIGKDPGGDLRQFQVLGGSNIAVVAENSSASYASLYASNSTSGGLAAQFENAAGPVARFGSNIIISDGTQGLGKVLTSDANGATSWQTPDSNPWQKNGNNIYYNNGWVGIGTSSISHPLTIENNNNTCYIRLKDNEGTGGMRIGAYTGELAFLNDNENENIRFSVKTPSGYEQMLTLKASDQKVGINVTTPPYNLSVLGTSVTDISIHSPGTGTGSGDGLRIGVSNSSGANAWVWNNENGDLYFGTNDDERMRITAAGNVGIGDASPDATLDVEGSAIIDGTLKIGSSGKVFSELREITGTTGAAGGSTTISYPSGYNMTNMRVLSLEINYNGNAWIGLGGNEQNSSVVPRVFYYLGSTNIMIYYPTVSNFQSRAFRMMVMKVQ